MRQTLTPELFEKLKDVKSSKGYSLSNAIQAGVLRPHLGVGITAGDEECFELFKEIIYPVVQGWHKFDPSTQVHKSDLDASKLVFSEEQASKFQKYVVSTRVRAARNIAGYSLPAGASKEDRLAVEGVLKEAFASLPSDLQGTYFPLGGLTGEQVMLPLSCVISLRSKGLPAHVCDER
jgi:creatine kinase